MPLNEAFELLKDDYLDYITYIKTKESVSRQIEMSKNNDDSCQLVNLLIEQLNGYVSDDALNSLKLKDLELLLTYLNRVKSKVIELLPNGHYKGTQTI